MSDDFEHPFGEAVPGEAVKPTYYDTQEGYTFGARWVRSSLTGKRVRVDQIAQTRKEQDMAVDFGATLKRAEEEGLIGGGDYLKFKEGDNRFRLMTECLAHADEFKGQRSFKWLCYVLDKRDGKVKPLFMPHTIYKQIVALQTNEDYAFHDVPMPYELNVHAMGAGTKEVKYTLIPARKNTDVGTEAMEQLRALKPLAELQVKLKEKKAKQQEPEPAHNDNDDERAPLTADDVPF